MNMPVYAIYHQRNWVYIQGLYWIRRLIRLFVPIYITHCPLYVHIAEIVFIKSTSRFYQRPYVPRLLRMGDARRSAGLTKKTRGQTDLS